MMWTLRYLLAVALVLLPFAEASATTTQIQVKDSGGTARNINVTSSDGTLSGNLSWNNVICDQSAGATCASVGTAGSPSTNALTIQAVTLGHGTAANAMRVELPTDGTGQVNAILNAETTKVIGTVRNLGNAGAILDFAGQNASSPANAWLTGCQFNTSPTTISSGNASPCQVDSAGNLLVTIKNSSNIAVNPATASNWGLASTAAAVPANALYVGFNSGGNLVGISSGNPLPVTAATLDPCQSVAKTTVPISQATSTQLLAGTPAKKTYVCSFAIIGADAENASLVGGTGSVCATSPTAIIGGSTAANGLNMAANGGIALGNGMATVAQGSVNADNVCLLQSGSGRVAGVLTYVQN